MFTMLHTFFVVVFCISLFTYSLLGVRVFKVPAVIMLPFLIWIQILSINAEHLCARPGEKVEIPSRNERKLPKVKWSYYRNGAKLFLISSGTDGINKHNANLQTKFRLSHDNSLVIEGMTIEFQGNYSRELCSKDDQCGVTNASLLLLKETYLGNKTKAIAAPGSVFIHFCPTEEADKMDSPSTVKWTSESIGKPVITFTLHGRSATEKAKVRKMLSNGSIYLPDVDSSDAGSYSCWVQRRPCHWINLLTVNLYVQTVLQDKKDPSHMMVVFGTLVTSLLALLLLCMVLHCRQRRSSEISTPNEQRNLEPSYRSTESPRIEMGETEYHVYSVLNITKPEQNCVIESQDTCIYSLIKTPPACTSGN